MRPLDFDILIPEELVSDFAADPCSQYDKVLLRSKDSSWPLFTVLDKFLDALPPSAAEYSYADQVFASLYGDDERLARVWFAQELIVDEISRRRIQHLAHSRGESALVAFAERELPSVNIDQDGMVRLADFSYNGSSLDANGYRFMTCLLNENFNSTYWLQKNFYEHSIAERVHIRLDPFLWGPCVSFPNMLFRMIVYSIPVDWDQLGDLREPRHGSMMPESDRHGTQLSEYCWDPRDDGIHFVCEELPTLERVRIQASRYLHAIYDPVSRDIIHFDGALRIYTEQQMVERRRSHVRNAGKAGIRKKIFKLDEPIDRTAFSSIAQAFFVWNDDLTRYFREGLG